VEVELGTSDGRIDLRLPEGISARLAASTSEDGRVHLDLPGAVENAGARRRRDHREATLGEGRGSIRLRASDGSIRVRLADGR
jgi:hypothetical protein